MACFAISSFIILKVGKRMIRYKASERSVHEEAVKMIYNT